MCLGIPGKIVAITGDLAEVDFSGVAREVSLLLCPEVHEGDYVLVHVGFAIQRLDEREALETLELFREMERSWDE
ncbi:MAG: HypC/HybG/HupF family hydrogenase formation chaperone [Deltaproteobacteria bacterium]|nr:HypC/HybG/HupF family hydrogenase formation chaperone [Deltaproteobacteria bacterium]MBW2078750.1 HypC/HybG/HupF family hydrogenase formation chaperone [Deltaproteobacteria bacterium]MBW2310293.1 HypC/HybG/HupF family hydrogenase formation chaperone [Deltaproteobacteria bacterium]RLB26802.1 MAG: HypC/HybG/HupF family hydrogenase formation chaperone [Deltaproteobacteria bacterium]